MSRIQDYFNRIPDCKVCLPSSQIGLVESPSFEHVRLQCSSFFTANTKVWNKSATFCPLLSSLPAHSRPLILFSIDFMSAEGHNFRSLFLSRDLLWARDITFLTRANRRKNWPSILSGETLKRA